MPERYDAIIIGTGQAGPPLAARMDREGWRVAVVERWKVGGTCVNYGCIPTKTLVGSARIAHFARHASRFGIKIDGAIRADMKLVKARKDQVAGESSRGVEDWIGGMARATLIRGHARFRGPHTVQVDDRTLESERIFINVGTRARVPDWPGIKEVPVLTNSSMLEVDFLPEHLVIIGGSYIGLEFAQIYRRFGSEVTVVEKGPRIMPREDEDVSDAVRGILEGEGVRFRLGADCIAARREGEGIAVRVHCEANPDEVVGSHLLAAVGRIPNTDDLGLDEAGIGADERGFIRVDDRLQTNVPGIWALGDCNGKGAFTHTSFHDSEIVAANLFDDDPRSVSDRIPCYALYTDPPLGRVGMTEREARASGRKVLVATRPMSKVGRAREFGDTRGFMKVLVDADTKEILGASLLGMSGDEVVHVLLDVMYARQPYTVVSRAVHIHPTVAELLPTLLQDLG
jgi:pyruvate/2-oxoglutarate dehydrogenase complex dihydrolipoamide dehydrogenase (E3) component